MLVKDHLHFLESVFVGQRLMKSWENLLLRLAFLVNDQAEVVAVPQYALPARRADLLSAGVAARRTRAKPKVVQLIGKTRNGVAAGGKQVEAVRNEICALRIRVDNPVPGCRSAASRWR